MVSVPLNFINNAKFDLKKQKFNSTEPNAIIRNYC